jgi:murein L,D-transpeptidase YcbB/YkuD
MTLEVHVLLIRLVIISILGLYSCAPRFSTSSVSQFIEKSLDEFENNPNFRISGESVLAGNDLLRFYQLKQFQPVWSNQKGLSKAADELLKVLSMASYEGLEPEDYHVPRLLVLKKQSIRSKFNDDELAHADLLFTDAYLLYARHLFAGKICPDEVNQEWYVPCREMELEYWEYLNHALIGDTVLSSLDQLKPQHAAYQELKAALSHYRYLVESTAQSIPSSNDDIPRIQQKLTIFEDLQTGGDDRESISKGISNFQDRHGLPSTGKVDSLTLQLLQIPLTDRIETIKANLERWRWLPARLGRKHIEVNMADFKLEVHESSQNVFEGNIIIGTPYHATPAFSATLTHIVLNPYWNLPKSIVINEILNLPNPAEYLERNNITVLNYQADTISVESINWEALDPDNLPFRMRQEPGVNNALGVIKFLLPNPYAVYIHDTPQKELFDNNTRTFSHGCIRLQNPLKLATYLLSSNPQWSEMSILDTIAHQPLPTEILLDEPLPVHVLYWTAWVDKTGNIHFRKDVYARDEPLIKALKTKLSG